MVVMIRVTMILALISLGAGLGILVKGADWLVDGASSLAKRLGISDLAIGLTVVAFGTSMPELVVNITSSFSGATEIAIGNIIGSNTANILLILGVSSMMTSISVQTSTVWKEIPFALLASLVVCIMANDALFDGASSSVITRSEGIVLIAFFAIFLWYISGMAKTETGAVGETVHVRGVYTSCGSVLAGLALLIGGGKLTVSGAVIVAQAIGVSESLIGLTIVAVGTSLPELATSVVAARKGNADIAVGNIVGSNIFNIFWILGVSAVIAPLHFAPGMNVDLLVTVAATVLLFFVAHSGHLHHRLLFWRQRGYHALRRLDGAIMLIAYIAYVASLVWRG
jgi:cation:H+ antiporter